MTTMARWFHLAALLTVAGLAAAGAQEVDGEDPWKDPEFQKRFLGTYGVLGEVEPRLSPEERAALEKIVPLMSSDLPKAAAELRAVVNERSSAVLDFTLGNIEFQLDRLDDAAKSYTAAVQKFPSFLRAQKNLGLVSVRRGDMARAIEALTRMIELGGRDGLSLGLLGHAYASRRDFLSAESAYRQAIMLQPETLDWKMGLARCLFQEQKYQEAVAICAELIERHPERQEFWQLQANAYIGLKEPMKAAQNIEVLARMGKAGADMLYTLGDIYVNESLMDLAVRAYLQALDGDPRQGAGRAQRAAEQLAARGASEQAKALVVRIREVYADRLAPAEQRRLLKLQARLVASDGAGADAVGLLEEIVALDPLDGEALLLLAQQETRLGNTEKAIFACERAESLEAFAAEARVRHAQLLVGRSRFQEAAALLKRAQELKPRDEIARYLEQVERIARARR